MFSTGGRVYGQGKYVGCWQPCGVREKWLVAEGLLEPEECFGFALNSASRLALPKICPLAFLTHMI